MNAPEEPVVFDCADIYTGVEEQLGQLIAMVTSRAGPECSRRIRIHTKFVPNLDDLAKVDHAYVKRIIDRSLQRLRRETLDLVQLHWWDFAIPGYIEAALHLLELQKEGKVLNIGVTNFDALHLRSLIEAGVPVVSNQVQYSVLDRRPGLSLAAYAEEHGVTLFCYGALAGGFLTETYLGAPEPQEPYANRSLIKYKLIIEEAGGWAKFQVLLSVLYNIALAHDCSIADVASGYVLQQRAVGAVIAGLPHGPAPRPPLKPLLGFTEEEATAVKHCFSQLPQVPGEVYELERQREGAHGKIMRYNLNTA
jgi:aryl-alcohol dehydrogenase-like predicted oxidoreductase